MSDEVASLKVEVDSTSVKAATADLDKLAAAGARTDGALAAMQRDMSKLSSTSTQARSAIAQMQKDMDRLANTDLSKLSTLDNWKKTLAQSIALNKQRFSQMADVESAGEAQITNIERLAQLAREGNWKSTLANRLTLSKQFFSQLAAQEQAAAARNLEAAAASRKAMFDAAFAPPTFNAGASTAAANFGTGALATGAVAQEAAAMEKAAISAEDLQKAEAQLGDISNLRSRDIEKMLVSLRGLGDTNPQVAATVQVLNKALADTRSAEAAAKAATDVAKATKTATTAQAAFRVESLYSGRAVTEYGAALSESLRGNYTRLEGTTVTLLNRTGLLRLAFSGTGAAVAGLAGSIILLATAQIKAADYAYELNNSLLLTGRSASISSAQLIAFAHDAQQAGESLSVAKDAAKSVAAIGEFNTNDYQKLIQGVTDFATLSGESTDAAAKFFAKLDEGNKGAIEEAQRQYGFLTDAQQKEIDSLLKMGENLQAGELALNQFEETMRDRANGFDQDAGVFIQAFHGIRDGWNDLMDDLGSLGSKRQLDTAKRDLKEFKDYVVGLFQDIHLGPAAPFAYAATMAGINQSEAENKPDYVSPQQQAAAQARKDSELVRQTTLNLQQMSEAYDKNSAKLAALNKLKANYLDLLTKEGKEGAAAAKADGVSLGADGNPTGGKYDKLVADINKRFSDKSAIAVENQSESMVASIKQQIDAMQQYVDTGNKVSSWEKFEAGIKEQLAKPNNKFTQTTKDAIAALLKEGDALNQQQKDMQAAAKAQEQLTRAQAKGVELNQRLADMAKSQHDQDTLGLAQVVMGGTQLDEFKDVSSKWQEYSRMIAETEKDIEKSTGDAHTQYMQQLSDEITARDNAIADVHNYYLQLRKYESDYHNGITTGLQQVYDQGANVAELTKGVVVDAFGQMTDALTTFVTTGKLNFKSLVASILTDIARMEIQIAESKIAGLILSYFGGVNSTAGMVSTNYSMVAGGGVAYAKGGAFGAAGPITAFANGSVFTNSIVSSPTFFRFANGTGLMGEAGPEAIMPLSKGPGGKLGVVAHGGSGGGNIINMQVITEVHADGTSTTKATSDQKNAMARALSQQVQQEAEKVVVRALQPGGAIWKAQNGRT